MWFREFVEIYVPFTVEDFCHFLYIENLLYIISLNKFIKYKL